jgi:tetratricopeptide (TPR) repeat protein
MSRYPGVAVVVLLCIGSLLSGPAIFSQQTNVSAAPPAASALTPEKALALAEQGHCRESISALKRALNSQISSETRKRAGVAGLRCALSLDDRESAADFIRLLNKQFGRDPDVLFILVHAYSDLSTRTSQDLGRTAPQSLAAHKLNAEALEMQGRWEPAQLEYEGILAKDPNAVGIHFLLGRSLLSQPNITPEIAERAKQEFLKEIQLDPKNAGALYILGELARRAEDWDDAIARFSQAANLDSNFAEAYLGWGSCLVAVKKFAEAVPPLRTAERLQPDNPAVHYNLAVALSRTGNNEEAQKEFAIHRQLTEKSAAGEDKAQ